MFYFYILFTNLPVVARGSHHRNVVLFQVTELFGRASTDHVYVSAVTLTLLHLGSTRLCGVMNG